jgi:dTDP-4-amino-4,6-dideoxygalactose transaminase
MKVPFLDFSEQYQTIKDEVTQGFGNVCAKGNFILGDEEKDFEKDFARYCGVDYAIGVNSGTDALYLALGALEIGPGDEVILPTFTFIATALCISYTGAKPVFVDNEDVTNNMDPQKLEDAITPNTKAIMPVHLYGLPAHMDEIRAIAQKHNIPVVEDAAQAHGSEYKGQKVGSLGDVACFSFYPTKGLGAFGDGGCIVTNRKEIYDTARMLRDYGREGRYEHKVKGFNSRLDTLQAVVLAAKLPLLDEWNEMRIANAAHYKEFLSGTEGIQLPNTLDDRKHVYQTYAVRVKNRDQVLEGMKEKGVGVLIHYPIPLHLQGAYKDLGHQKGDFPMAERLADEVLSLPMFPHMSKDQIAYVCKSLKEVVVP